MTSTSSYPTLLDALRDISSTEQTARTHDRERRKVDTSGKEGMERIPSTEPIWRNWTRKRRRTRYYLSLLRSALILHDDLMRYVRTPP
jgi:hypothetical protein